MSDLDPVITRSYLTRIDFGSITDPNDLTTWTMDGGEPIPPIVRRIIVDATEDDWRSVTDLTDAWAGAELAHMERTIAVMVACLAKSEDDERQMLDGFEIAERATSEEIRELTEG